MNYSCIPDVGFFDSPEFFSRALHIVTAVSVPIHSFGLYVLLTKTPEFMKTVKWYLINLHIWIILFDYTLSFLLIPVMMFPAFMGYPLGLLRLINIYYLYPLLMGLAFFAFVLVSIVAVFENQFYTICSYTLGANWTKWRRPWRAFRYIFVFFAVLTYQFFVPEQEESKQRAFKILPCLPQNVYEAPIFVFAENSVYHISTFIFFMAWISSEILFFVSRLVRNIQSQLKSRKMSQKTYRLQRQFFIALVIQMLLPLVLLIIPCAYSWVAVIAKYYKQAYINIAIVVGSMHGLLSTVVMLFIHQPYREAMKTMFFGVEAMRRDSKRRTGTMLMVSVQITIEKV